MTTQPTPQALREAVEKAIRQMRSDVFRISAAQGTDLIMAIIQPWLPPSASEREKRLENLILGTEAYLKGECILHESNPLFAKFRKALAEPTQPASPVPSGEPTAEEMLDWLEKFYSESGVGNKAHFWKLFMEDVSIRGFRWSIRMTMAHTMRGSKEAK